jgi:hypothetical protein
MPLPHPTLPAACILCKHICYTLQPKRASFKM